MKQMSRGYLRNVLSVAVLLMLIGGAVIGARAWSRAQSQTVSIEMGTHQFTPASVTRIAGPLHLEVKNQSGRQSFTLQLKRDNGGAVVQEWNVQAGAGQVWATDVDLQQGGYNLSVVENPACMFHITAQ